MKPSLINAALNLVPGARLSYDGTSITWHDYETPPVTDEQIQLKFEELLREYDNKEYQHLRASKYPPIGDQLDALFHAGVFPAEMAAKLQAVKDQYPKP